MSASRLTLKATVVAGLQFAPLLLSVPRVRMTMSPALCAIGDPSGVALTFDDGPDLESTPSFIDALNRLGWRATFFLLGDMTRRYPSVARDLADAGHEVAVHGDRHRNHAFRRPADVRDDIRQATETIAAITGTAPRWYRPPYGAVSWATMSAVRDLGLDLVLWSTWGRDWRIAATPMSIHDDVMRGLRPGGSILLHDSDCTSSPDSWKATLDALPLLDRSIRAMGLEVRALGDHGI